ncbi:hypothetical protein L910_2840 [Vibrio fluvialis PG41]|uniref:Uncharacterized protein n=1 Tax=Vibrio fluvialis PG41 TaxID=1336752 RepID=S7HVB6_VIBFL|nr:hypothetical protein L910_2840 [Vibrio fluvialis PG41]
MKNILSTAKVFIFKRVEFLSVIQNNSLSGLYTQESDKCNDFFEKFKVL